MTEWIPVISGLCGIVTAALRLAATLAANRRTRRPTLADGRRTQHPTRDGRSTPGRAGTRPGRRSAE
ncbi:hypothetical protein [Actinomadura gamaensis]|uniref:Uncharacterized protein n=1 Tax=Actinomadura gamaensis TaxID=1763541 RepID=A0ABV9TYK0_9ACTN